jgi:hypothetical protein
MQVPISFDFLVNDWGFPISLAAIISSRNASHTLNEQDLSFLDGIDNAWRCGDIDRRLDYLDIMIYHYLTVTP